MTRLLVIMVAFGFGCGYGVERVMTRLCMEPASAATSRRVSRVVA